VLSRKLGLEAGLRRLKLATFRRVAPELFCDAKAQRWSPEELLRAFVEAEVAARDASMAAARLRAAGFSVKKTLDELDLSASNSRTPVGRALCTKALRVRAKRPVHRDFGRIFHCSLLSRAAFAWKRSVPHTTVIMPTRAKPSSPLNSQNVCHFSASRHNRALGITSERRSLSVTGGASWRSRAGEVISWKAPYGYRRVPRGTYRSVLRRDLAGKPPRAGRFPPSPAARPYSSQEIAELFSLASSQRSHWRRSSALSFLALGIGAGLRSGELAAVRGDDISSEHDPVVVGVAAKRLVPVVGSYAIALVEQACEAGAGYLFCPGRADRAYKNFVNNFCYGLAASPPAPCLSSGRAQVNFICAHLAAGTPSRNCSIWPGSARSSRSCATAATCPGCPAPRPS
jgi:hypothetical protein